MAGVKEGACVERCGAERGSEAGVGVAWELDQGHLGWAALRHRDAVALRQDCDAGAEALAHLAHDSRTVDAAQLGEGGDRCCHRDCAAPERACGEHGGCGVAEAFDTGYGGERVAVGDGFAEGGQVWADADRFP